MIQYAFRHFVKVRQILSLYLPSDTEGCAEGFIFCLSAAELPLVQLCGMCKLDGFEHTHNEKPRSVTIRKGYHYAVGAYYTSSKAEKAIATSIILQVGSENLKLIPITSTGGDIMQGHQPDRYGFYFLDRPMSHFANKRNCEKESKFIISKSQKYGSQKNPQKSVISQLPL